MTPLEHAEHVVDHGGECHLDGSTCDACPFMSTCGPGTNLMASAQEILDAEYGPGHYASFNYEDPRYQAMTIIEGNGNCPGSWDCEHCALYKRLENGDCYPEEVYLVAENLIAELDECGNCKSIW